MNNLDTLKNWIDSSRNTVVITGAGFSTESGIPDFRSSQGLYENRKEYGYPPETIISKDFLHTHPDIFDSFCRKELIYRDAIPNNAHLALAKLESQGKLSTIITQNIDGLHTKAGSRNVVELHGTMAEYYCMDCHRTYTLDEVIGMPSPPKCHTCDGHLRPDIVLYGEFLKSQVYSAAEKAVTSADLLIIAGTSLSVSTATGLLGFFKGNRLVIVNGTSTPYDTSADLVIHDSVGKVFGAVVV